ncbi:glycoside hydrolase family 19 protein [Tahibacter harae]|uniref:Chitinase n=1 Tax=Tahibacter harae TaxID=2963937 RepID=A0ABT1QS64_9GAMM|nr:hypothetical protein [Tahibacter harae]MCQ4165128.1 hypothetical protein [Tahibacter harae]
MDVATFARATGCSNATALRWVGPVSLAAVEFGILNPRHFTMWLANIGHESGGFRHTRELWGPTPQQLRYERDFEQPWPATAEQAREKAFARNRLAWLLGNTEPGDGRRFAGHGLIQVTGRTNHMRCGSALGLDLAAQPELLELEAPAARSAGWFWRIHGMAALADAGDFAGIVRRINGGNNGLDDRIARWERAERALAN